MSNITVIIKSATQSVEDFGVECDLSWSIGHLKEVLEESYPNNPKKESQKLIYGGKLLPDHLSLKSILNHSQERHIIHLVCPTPTKVNTNESKQQAAPQSFPVPPINPGFAPLNSPSFGAVPGMSVPSINTADTFQQYLAMQQVYSQFMTQYLSQYNGGVPPTVPYVPTMTTPQTQTPQGPATQQNLAPNRQRQALEEERDYLDYFYSISRALLLFIALYYYSSLSRILLVITMFMCMTMYIRINRQIRHRHPELQRPDNDVPESQSVPSEQTLADIEPTEVQEPVTARNDEATSSTPAESSTNNDALSQQAEQRSFTSVISTTASLISAFFSSLIPSDPVPVNVN